MIFATKFDRRLYVVLCAAADAGLPCPITDDLVDEIGCESNSTPAECLARLEAARMVVVKRYQKHRVVTITATGRSTAEPANPKMHWRDRPLGQAAAALKLIERVQPGAEIAIRGLSEQQGRAAPDLVTEMIRLGWQAMGAGTDSARPEAVGG